MNDLDQRSATDEFSIIFHFTDGDILTQSLSIDHADTAQDVIDWFKDKRGSPVWTWLNPHSARVQMIPRSKVVFIEIIGYIQPDGQKSKWYQRIIDKYQAWRMTHK